MQPPETPATYSNACGHWWADGSTDVKRSIFMDDPAALYHDAEELLELLKQGLAQEVPEVGGWVVGWMSGPVALSSARPLLMQAVLMTLEGRLRLQLRLLSLSACVCAAADQDGGCGYVPRVCVCCWPGWCLCQVCAFPPPCGWLVWSCVLQPMLLMVWLLAVLLDLDVCIHTCDRATRCVTMYPDV